MPVTPPQAPGCPVLHHFDPLVQDFLASPYPVMSAWRGESPVFYEPTLEYYVVTRYRDVQRIMSDRTHFSAANASSPMWPVDDEAKQILDQGFPRVPTLNNADPPRHTVMRKAVLSCLPPRRFAALEPSLRDYARGLVERVVSEPVVDLVDTFTFPFPAFGAFSLIGFPAEDTDLIRDWCRPRVLLSYGRLPPSEQGAVATRVVEFWHYIEQFVHDRHAHLTDDFTSDLLRLHDADPDRVTEPDIVNIVYSMALAGHETTTNLLTNTIHALLSDRERWERLRADRSLIPGALEEGMRFDSPILCWRRIAREDVDVGGFTIPADAKVLLLFGSAHYDPDEFADPEVFDPGRANASDHFAFGHGAHYCLGAPLARLEGKIGLELLIEAAPEMHLAEHQPRYSPTLVLHGIERLLVEPNVDHAHRQEVTR
jgi:cytochrome P450